SQPSGSSSSPKHSSHFSGSQMLLHESWNVHFPQASRFDSEHSGVDPRKMSIVPFGVFTWQQPKQSQPFGTSSSHVARHSGGTFGSHSCLNAQPMSSPGLAGSHCRSYSQWSLPTPLSRSQ